MDFLRLGVRIATAARRIVGQEAWPGVLSLPLEEHVAVGPALFRQQVGQRSTQHHHLAQGPETVSDRKHMPVLKDVPRDAHDVCTGAVVYFLAGVLVAKSDRAVSGGKRRQREQTQGWKHSIVWRHIQEMLHAPVRWPELWLNQVNAWRTSPP